LAWEQPPAPASPRSPTWSETSTADGSTRVSSLLIGRPRSCGLGPLNGCESIERRELIAVVHRDGEVAFGVRRGVLTDELLELPRSLAEVNRVGRIGVTAQVEADQVGTTCLQRGPSPCRSLRIGLRNI
jgi:hypothetical protein